MSPNAAPPDNCSASSDLLGLFAETMARLALAPPFAVAVSGGPDSTALMLLTARWCENQGHEPPTILTIDHTLRAAAADEARQVAAWAAKHGLGHRTLRWHRDNEPTPDANIQARARNARYQLLANDCRTHNINTILTAHTLEDQAETFLLRLARGSGLIGLAAMAEIAPFPVPLPPRDALTLARPLLNVSKHHLRAFLESLDHPWIDDPSNTDLRFDRVRMRHALEILGDAGLTPARVAQTAAKLATAADTRKQHTDKLRQTAVTLHATGWAEVHWPAFADAGNDIGLETLAYLLKSLGGRRYPPRRQKLLNVWNNLNAPDQSATAWTLSGCKMTRRSDTIIRITREPGRPGNLKPVPLTQTETPTLWDNRFWITATGTEKSKREYTINGLSSDGVVEISRQLDIQHENNNASSYTDPNAALKTWQTLPHDVKLTLPAIRYREDLVAVPHLNMARCPDLKFVVEPANNGDV